MEYMQSHPGSHWDDKTNSDPSFRQTQSEIDKIEERMMREHLSKEQLKLLDGSFAPTDLHVEKETNLAKDWLMSGSDDDKKDNKKESEELDPEILKSKNEFLKHEQEIIDQQKETEKLL